MASDGTSIFLLDANGTFDTKLNQKGFPIKGNYGNAFVKVSTLKNKLTITDYFAGYDTVGESKQDIDREKEAAAAARAATMKTAPSVPAVRAEARDEYENERWHESLQERGDGREGPRLARDYEHDETDGERADDELAARQRDCAVRR